MKYAIHQPAFLPWGGYFAKALAADRMVIMTGVAPSKGDCSNRVKLNGSWLTLPLVFRGSTFERVSYDENAGDKIITTLRQALGSKKQPYSERLSPIMEVMSQFNTGNLVFLTENLVRAVVRELHHPLLIRSCNYAPVGDTTEDRLRDFIRFNKLEGTYLSGAGGKAYLKPSQNVLFQQCDFPDETFLKAFVTEPDPIDYLRSRCQWLCN